MTTSRHRLDTSTSFSGIDYGNLPASEDIEDPDQKPLARENPATIVVPREPYVSDKKLAEAVDLAIALGRPLLLQGDPGSGKTRLAYAVAYALKLPLEVAPVKSTSRAQDLLYTYDAVNRLYDAQLGEAGPREEDGVSPKATRTANYIHLGPLGRAIARAAHGRRSVVLIDEIDKADLDFPNDLLWELEELAFAVPGAPELDCRVPRDRPDLRPIVLITHNEEKALPAAFLRRCVWHYVKFPENEQQLLEIIELHRAADPQMAAHDAQPQLTARAVRVLAMLRKMDLLKRPGLSELLDWLNFLRHTHVDPETLESLPYAGALLKQASDMQRAQTEINTAHSRAAVMPGDAQVAESEDRGN